MLAHARASGAAVATVFGGGPLEAEAGGLSLTLGERRAGRPSAAAFARLVAACRESQVVHTHLFAGDLWGGLAARLADRPQLSHEHNVDLDEPAHVRAARRLSARLPAATLAVSEAAARHSFAHNVTVVANGIDLTRFSAAHRGGAGVLAIGRCVPQKGFDVLLAALPPGIPARIAGEGPDQPAHPQVSWLGLRTDIPDLLATADVLVVPSRWEGFGLAALEGMAAGVPVIASAVPGLAELVGSAGVLVPAGDAGALREAITRVLGDLELQAELRARGRERAQNFGLQTMVDGWERAHRRLMPRSR